MEGTERAVIHIRAFGTKTPWTTHQDVEVRVPYDGFIDIGEKLAVAANGNVKIAEPGDEVIGIAMETTGPPWCILIREEY